MSADTETAIVTLIRSRVDRCAAGMDRNLQPCGPFVTELQRQQATDLALRWVHAADDMQVTIRDLDAVASLADNALDAIRARDRREAAS